MRPGKFALCILPIVAICLSECSLLGLEKNGDKKAKVITSKEMQKYHKTLKITKDTCYSFMPWFLDSMPLYIDTLNGIYKSLYKPLGYQVYDSAGRIASIVINPNASDSKNKQSQNFNLNKKMEVFPPQSDIKIIKIFLLNQFLSFTNYPLSQLTKNDYTVVVVYGKWMNKQTKQLIKGVRINQSHIPKNLKVKYIYINNDNVFANSGL